MGKLAPGIELRALAEQLQPSLKPSRGPTPEVPNIMAAILLARDASLGGRGACRLVAGVNEDAAHSRVAKLAVKVRALMDNPTVASLSPPTSPPPPPPAMVHGHHLGAGGPRWQRLFSDCFAFS